MSKKDFRLYCEEEYIDHLKAIADEKGTSVNQLVLSVLTKKYPMPKKKKDQTTGPILDIEATKKHYEQDCKDRHRDKNFNNCEFLQSFLCRFDHNSTFPCHCFTGRRTS